ncbi:MAG: hypothetical protein DRO87_10655, partial [Candidatus Thorarchaeota archaeon]
MKTYHIVLALLFACAIAGIQMQPTDTDVLPSITITPQAPHAMAEIAPFDTAVVWSTTTGSQIVDLVVANFDGDADDEVAVITQNGSLYLFNESSSLLWKLNLGSAPHAIAAADATAENGLDIVVGTDKGVIVVASNKSVVTNITLPEATYAVTGANLDGDVYDEIVVGCDDFYIYAYEIDTTPVWSYLSNGQVRKIVARDIDADSRDEILGASILRQLVLLEDTGAVAFIKTSDTPINVIGFGDLTPAANLDVVMGNSNGTLTVWDSTGTLAYTKQVIDSITALVTGDLITGGRNELA